MYDTSPEDEDNTVSSASLCMSPTSVVDRTMAPLCSSTPLVKQNGDLAKDKEGNTIKPATINGYKSLDTRKNDSDAVNGNVKVNVVSNSTTSIDVLSGGESDAGDTLSRRFNNNSISSKFTNVSHEATDTFRRRGDVTYSVAKELLLTERTYKRDLELITVTWSLQVGSLADLEARGPLARACLALGPLALAQGAFLARLERALAANHANTNSTGIDDNEEPEYKKVAELMNDYLTSTQEEYESYTSRAGPLVGLVESSRRRSSEVARECSAFDNVAPLPLSCLLLRPLHRLLYYERLAAELSQLSKKSVTLPSTLAQQAQEQLLHVENHAALCQLQRDIIGYDKLLVAEREFIRLGCVYKHSTRGLIQRMLFLFSDVLVLCSKSGSKFRAMRALPLRTLRLRTDTLPHSFGLAGDDVNLLFSASNESEFSGWYRALSEAIENAQDNTTDVDTDLTPYEEPVSSSSPANSGGALTHVCWHRVTSIDRMQLHVAMRTQLSGYLLRKFKNSHGWQKLWVVLAASALHFYKAWHEPRALASLPLTGYTVCPPSDSDAIHKEFVFKLQYKNHVYFFRADTQFTYNRWTETLQTVTVHYNNNNEEQ